MLEITSDSNQMLKKIKQLQQKKYRKKFGQMVIEGIRFCEEARLHQAEIEGVFISEDLCSTLDLSEWEGHPLYKVKSGLLEKALNTATPQGIAMIVAQPTWQWEEVKEMSNVVILDGVQDPGNVGTILRTALAANVDGVIALKGSVDHLNDKTLRSTMGAIFTLPIYCVDDGQELMKELNQWGFKVVVAEVSATHYYDEYNYPQKTALVLGNEGNGPLQIKQGDIEIKIPMNPKAESLNVAIAGGVILYELQRQKRAR